MRRSAKGDAAHVGNRALVVGRRTWSKEIRKIGLLSEGELGQRTSKRPAAPIPPPMHMVTTTFLILAPSALRPGLSLVILSDLREIQKHRTKTRRRGGTLGLEEDVADDARARHAEGVADGDGAAVDVDEGGVEAELCRRVERDDREGLVDLPEVDLQHGAA